MIYPSQQLAKTMSRLNGSLFSPRQVHLRPRSSIVCECTESDLIRSWWWGLAHSRNVHVYFDSTSPAYCKRIRLRLAARPLCRSPVQEFSSPTPEVSYPDSYSSGVKRVAWPPPPEENDQESQPEAPVRQAAPAKVYQSPALSRLIPIEQEFSPPQSKVYSPQPIQPASPFSPVPSQGKPLSPLPSQVKPLSPQPAFGIRSPLSPQPSTPTQTFPPPLPEALHKVPSQTSAFCRPAPRGFGPVSPPAPVVAKPFTPEPEYYPAPLSYQGFGPVASAAAPTASESPRGWAPVPSPTPLVAPVQSQFVEPPPATVTLRPAAPIHQAPPPLVTSQPATNSFRGGVNMRGDQKWPPQAVKDAVAAENEARIELAKGPACRPRKVKRDYSNFFAQNALPHNYPGYRAPPGTQHFEDMTGRSQY